MDIKFILRESLVVRFFASPFKRYKLRKELDKYIESEYSSRIKKYHNIHNGEKCFIVGNGPSLTVNDLESISKYPTFASNSIFRIYSETEWRPTYYLCVDPTYINCHRKEIIELVHSKKFISCRASFPDSKETERIFEYNKFKVNKWNDKSAFVNDDVSKFFSVGYTVTYTALQLAFYMGFKEIVLLGIDFTYPVARNSSGKIIETGDRVAVHFYKDTPKEQKYNVFNYDGALHAYNKAKEYSESNGIKIWNATRGGKLEVFDRKALEGFM